MEKIFALSLSPRSFSLPRRACGSLGQGSPAFAGCGELRGQWKPGPGPQNPKEPKQRPVGTVGSPGLWQKDWNFH